VNHVDEVKASQSARLVFSSLLTHIAPEVKGIVTLVSAGTLTDERSGITYFRTEIALGTESLEQLDQIELVPGMPVDAFIQTADRTPMSYLLKPFTDYFRAAFLPSNLAGD
jgi:HlyD family secretion protein